MQVTTPIRNSAKRAGCVAVIGLAPLLALHIDLASANRSFDGLGRDIGVTGSRANGSVTASPDQERAGWIRLSYRFQGTKKAKKSKK